MPEFGQFRASTNQSVRRKATTTPISRKVRLLMNMIAGFVPIEPDYLPFFIREVPRLTQVLTHTHYLDWVMA